MVLRWGLLELVKLSPPETVPVGLTLFLLLLSEFCFHLETGQTMAYFFDLPYGSGLSSLLEVVGC
jgi:hypothetical protein